MTALREQGEFPVFNPAAFGAVRTPIENAFSSAGVKGFLKSVKRAGLRIRDFEGVLRGGLLGASTAAEYDALGSADQGHIREFYLTSLEKVAPELRAEFFKLYSYY